MYIYYKGWDSHLALYSMKLQSVSKPGVFNYSYRKSSWDLSLLTVGRMSSKNQPFWLQPEADLERERLEAKNVSTALQFSALGTVKAPGRRHWQGMPSEMLLAAPHYHVFSLSLFLSPPLYSQDLCRGGGVVKTCEPRDRLCC